MKQYRTFRQDLIEKIIDYDFSKGFHKEYFYVKGVTRSMRQLEHLEAVAFINWWGYYANTKKIDERLLFAIPNGGFRSWVTGKKLKAEGVRPGIPDYFLAIPLHGYHGLFLELKIEKGKLAETQKTMISILGNNQYFCAVAYGTEMAMDLIRKYVG